MNMNLFYSDHRLKIAKYPQQYKLLKLKENVIGNKTITQNES